MDKGTITIFRILLKELDLKFQNFLEFIDRLQPDILRLDAIMARQARTNARIDYRLRELNKIGGSLGAAKIGKI